MDWNLNQNSIPSDTSKLREICDLLVTGEEVPDNLIYRSIFPTDRLENTVNLDDPYCVWQLVFQLIARSRNYIFNESQDVLTTDLIRLATTKEYSSANRILNKLQDAFKKPFFLDINIVNTYINRLATLLQESLARGNIDTDQILGYKIVLKSLVEIRTCANRLLELNEMIKNGIIKIEQ